MTRDVNNSNTIADAKAPADGPPEKVSRWRQLLMLSTAVGISVGVFVLTTQYHEQLQSLGSAGLIGLFFVSMISNATLVIPAPGFVFACAAGTLYGYAVVGIVAGLGATLGELTGYMAGYGGNAIIPKGAVYERLHTFMLRRGTLAIFLLAAIPNPLFDIGGMLAGIIRMPVWKFIIAAWMGKAVRLGLLALTCLVGIPWLQQLLAPH